jgi:hypothetical protein
MVFLADALAAASFPNLKLRSLFAFAMSVPLLSCVGLCHPEHSHWIRHFKEGDEQAGEYPKSADKYSVA